MGYHRDTFIAEYDQVKVDRIQNFLQSDTTDYIDDEYDQFDADDLQSIPEGAPDANFGIMSHDTLIAYWRTQSAPMRSALLAFWRNAATSPTCPNSTRTLFAGVVATLQRMKKEYQPSDWRPHHA